MSFFSFLQEELQLVSKQRQKQEATKIREFQKKDRQAITEDAANKASRETAAIVSQQKAIMTTKHSLATQDNTTASTKKKKRKVTQQTKKPTKTPATIEPRRVLTSQQPQPKQQGLRKVPLASDTHGCVHSGLRDLIVLDRAHLTSFVKKDGWLYNKPCRDCAEMQTETLEYNNRILNMATLLQKGNRVFGHYCNCGQTGHKMDDNDPYKPDYNCNLVLCPKCFAKRESKQWESTSGRQTQGATAI